MRADKKFALISLLPGLNGNSIGVILDLCSRENYEMQKYTGKDKLHGDLITIEISERFLVTYEKYDMYYCV